MLGKQISASSLTSRCWKIGLFGLKSYFRVLYITACDINGNDLFNSQTTISSELVRKSTTTQLGWEWNIKLEIWFSSDTWILEQQISGKNMKWQLFSIINIYHCLNLTTHRNNINWVGCQKTHVFYVVAWKPKNEKLYSVRKGIWQSPSRNTDLFMSHTWKNILFISLNRDLYSCN